MLLESRRPLRERRGTPMSDPSPEGLRLRRVSEPRENGMLFDFEPSGINDSCLRVRRRGGHCILYPAGVWNGLIRLNYLIASPASAEPYLVFRAVDVGYDDGRFTWRGRATPVAASTTMLDMLVERGIATAEEAERLLYAGPPERAGSVADTALMLRAVLGGAAFAPITRDGAVVGYALRTLADAAAYVLDADDGLPVLDDAARAALRRQVVGMGKPST